MTIAGWSRPRSTLARGKAGGVKFCTEEPEVWNAADELLGKRLVTHQTGPEGKVVHRLYVEAATDIRREIYLGLVLDRESERIMILRDCGVTVVERPSEFGTTVAARLTELG